MDREIPKLDKLKPEKLPNSRKSSSRGKFMQYILKESGYDR